MRVGYEIQLWAAHFLKLVPGQIGCYLRNLFLPYQNGGNVKVWDGVHIDSPSLLVLGDNVSVNRGSIIHAGGGVEIGSDVLIGPYVTIYSQNHRYQDRGKKIREQGFDMAKVIIGNNVWIAANATILPGVVIGDNCVVAANSVVVCDVPPDTLVAGNPAVPKRSLTNKLTPA